MWVILILKKYSLEREKVRRRAWSHWDGPGICHVKSSPHPVGKGALETGTWDKHHATIKYSWPMSKHPGYSLT